MILITGATGFIGRRLSQVLPQDKVRLLIRNPSDNKTSNTFVASIDGSAQYANVLKGVSVVIHTAARTHVMNEELDDPLSAYREVNTAGTINLARQAASCGVKRFIFLSSVKVNGESTAEGESFTQSESIAPLDPYGVSKAEAEHELRVISDETGMEIVIIRPPLVYGPAVKANFALMMKLARKNPPLPVGAIHNKRSLIALDNLIDLIVTCIDHPSAANQTFLVSDDYDISTTELFEMMILAAGNRPRLIPVPQRCLEFAGKLLGKQEVIRRLCGNLQIDITYTKSTLNWQPPLSVDEGIRRCFDDSYL